MKNFLTELRNDPELLTYKKDTFQLHEIQLLDVSSRHKRA
jgi:hypothetical protein